MQRVFKALCYDEHEDDLWQYRNAPQQDCLTERAPLKIRSRIFSSAGLRFSGFPKTPENWVQDFPTLYFHADFQSSGLPNTPKNRISIFFLGRSPVLRFPVHP